MVVRLTCSYFKDTLLTMENVTLMFTLKYLYNSKFDGQPLTEKAFLLAYRGLTALIICMSIPISLWAMNVDKILGKELN